MFNLEDDSELAAFSKDAAERFEAPIAASWNNFLPKLNEAMPAEAKRKKRFILFWVLVAAIALTAGGYELYTAPTSTLKANKTSLVATTQNLPQHNNIPSVIATDAIKKGSEIQILKNNNSTKPKNQQISGIIHKKVARSKE
jgi:hypothetical protein